MKSAAALARATHWIFDLDGTLTLAVHDFEALRRRLGLPSGAPILEAIAERPRGEQAGLLATVAAWEGEALAAAAPADGAVALLTHLAERGCALGILTRNLHGIARATLARCGLDRWFPAERVVGREEAAAKPDPAGVHHLLHQWQAPPEQAVMVGDYLYDLQAGRHAGVHTVHVGALPGWPEWTDLQASGLREVLEIIRGF